MERKFLMSVYGISSLILMTLYVMFHELTGADVILFRVFVFCLIYYSSRKFTIAFLSKYVS